ncbi:MAG: hypothetical protein HY556_01210 [Euryarchaeota archaeon]|nr:hypothetical protein [Euryarchaeota archaeon]
MDLRLPLAAVAVLGSLLVLSPSFDKASSGLDGLVTDIIAEQSPPDKLPDIQPPKDVNITPPKDLPKEIPPDLKISPELLKQLAAMGLDPQMGGMTGQNKGNFSSLPQDQFRSWNMDRESGADRTTCDAAFDPALGCMKRLRSFDRLEADYSMGVADQTLKPIPISQPPGSQAERAKFTGRFPVVISQSGPTPIFSVAADMQIHGYSSDPPTSFTFWKDGADGYYVKPDRFAEAKAPVLVNLSIEVSGPQYYYILKVPRGTTLSDVPAALRPSFPSQLRDEVKLVTDKLNITGETDYGKVVNTLSKYFNDFGEGEIPDESTYPDKFLAIALGEQGCCRHRAFAFMVIAQSYGIPTRVIANEGHAFVEVNVPDIGWEQINLGGCGSYTLNNPRDSPMFEPVERDGENPRDDVPAPEPVSPTIIPTVTDIVEYTQAAKKGDPITVKGYVREVESKKGVSGVPIELFLNKTKEAPGASIGHGRTDSNGDFAIVTSIPQGLGAADYHLVSHAEKVIGDPNLVYLESWSDPILRVESASAIELTLPEREGIGSPTVLQGRLTDLTGLAIDGRNVTVAVDGTTALVETDRAGVFSRNHTFTTAGPHRVVATFAGDEFYSASAANASVKVDDVSLVGEPELTLVRGTDASVRMRLVLGPQGVPRTTIGATLDLAKPGLCGKSCTVPRAVQVKTTDGDGNVTFIVHADASASPGTASIDYTSDRYGKLKTQPVRIMFKPVLGVEAPASARGGENITARLILVDDKGAPMPGVEVSATLVSPAGNVTFKNRTDARGVAEVRIGTPRSAGSGFLQASYAGDSGAVPVNSTAPFEVLAAKTTEVTPPVNLGTLTTLLFLAVPVAAIAGAAYFLKNRMPKKRAAVEVAAGVRLEMKFNEIDDDLPDVWGPGTPVTLEVRLTRTIAPEGPIAGQVELKIDEETLKLTTDAEGAAGHTVTFDKEADVVCEATHVPASGPWVSATRVLRLVDYRREIEQEYKALLETVKAKGLPVKHDTTPRELEAMIVDTLETSTQAPTVMAAGRRGADEAVSVFEITNYGTRHLTRDDFVRFYRAKRAVLEYLGVE